MSLLTIAKAIAINVSIQPPTTVLANSSPDAMKIVQFTQEAGAELARRVDWRALHKTTTLTGTGANDALPLPVDFARLSEGGSVNGLRVGLSEDEWNSLTPEMGTPRFGFLSGNTLSFYPYLAFGATETVQWQSANWCSSNSATWADDSNTALVPEDLVTLGAIWRWRRHHGSDFQDYMAEYEAALADRAKFDGGLRSP
jgi:hypothetical protein